MQTKRKISKDNLCDKALVEIRESILSLKFSPGERLVIDRIADTLSISRTPIREALKELVNEGFLIYDKISYKVIDITKKDVTEIFAIRKALEVLAAGEAAKYCSEGTKKSLLKALEKSSPKEKKDNNYYEIAYQKLHLLIAESSQNPRLFNLLASYQNLIRLVLSWTYKITQVEIDRKIILDENEHRSIIQAIIENRIDDAKTAMAFHIDNAEKRTLLAIEQMDDAK